MCLLLDRKYSIKENGRPFTWAGWGDTPDLIYNSEYLKGQTCSDDVDYASEEFIKVADDYLNMLACEASVSKTMEQLQ